MKNKETYRIKHNYLHGYIWEFAIKHEYSCVFTLFFICSCIVYFPFLVGNRVFISSNDAMDLYDQFYPILLRYSDFISTNNTKTQMDFALGLGTEVSFGFPTFSTIPAYFGRMNVAYAIGLVQVIKIIISGFFFYVTLRKMGKKNYNALICSIAYSYSGVMITRQFWLSYSTEIAVLAIWLFACELAIQDKNFTALPLATFLFTINLASVYYLIIWLAILFVYIFYRMLDVRNNFESDSIRNAIAIALIFLICALLTYGLPNMFEDLKNAFGSSRFEAGITESKDNAIEFNKISPLLVFIRLIGNSINGIKNNYIGEYDWLNDPALYIGMFPLLLIVPCFFTLKKRQKIVFSVAIFFSLCYVFGEQIRMVANGFAGKGFKQSSLWITVLMLFVFAEGIENVIENTKRYQVIIVAIEILILLMLSILYEINYRGLYDVKLLLVSILFSAVYWLAIIECGYNNAARVLSGKDSMPIHKKKAVVLFVVAVMVVEHSGQMVEMLRKVDLKDSVEINDKSGYNNETTLEALAFLDDLNEQHNYRVDKQYFDYRFNDSWAQGYYGTSFYLGGTGVSEGIINLYDSLKLPTSSAGYKYAYGASMFSEIGDILGVKYVLSHVENIANYRMKLIKKIEGKEPVYIFENTNCLAMGLFYDSALSSDEYYSLDVNSRRKALISSCVVDSDSVDSYLQRKSNAFDDLSSFEVPISYDLDRGIWVIDRPLEKGKVLILACSLEDSIGANEWRADLWYGGTYRYEGFINSYKVRIDEGEDSFFEINAEGTQWINISNIKHEYSVKAYVVDQGVYYSESDNQIERLRNTELSFDKFCGSEICGTVNCPVSGIVVLSIPYGNWRVLIDGKEVETFVANLAFTGFEIEKGFHSISAVYVDRIVDNRIVNDKILFFICLLIVFGGWARRKKIGARCK